MTKEEIAIKYFRDGFNCSQAVFTTFSESLGLDTESSLKLSCGFGAGMGRLQDTCGAVTGAYMTLGLKYGKFKKEDDPAREKTYSLVQEFDAKFKQKYNTTSCKNLLNCDLMTEEGHNFFKNNNLREKTCENCIKDAVSIVEKMI
ncbi:MAG: hypothetical protein A2086_12065 [Spirochaetes bacterium GWD1_27_9]|nr:MAG: hypothetical protein A2Z98_03015 [Spirochaetes bacterium GWB1_27_13]OHD22924.1 MAG: hypothetical protein A2Y34_09125 [Spirochaetes bacterium GWC1_27_15]OHD28966.1 MAG: hypothetical protein A2086_12065 [Spirochaetes bacterium GWD1_27_9]